MTAEWLSALAAIATFVVVLASALAALIQLRHLRSSNQITLLTDFRRTIESADFSQAMQFVRFELPRRIADPATASAVAAMPPFNDDYVAVRQVGNFFESMGLLAKTGIVDSDLICDMFSDIIKNNWNALAPVITTVRANTNPSLWENFEYLVVITLRYDKAHPITYPRGLARMPVDTSLADRAGTASAAVTE